MIRTNNDQLNSPSYWNDQYRNEQGSGKQRIDADRFQFVLAGMRDVAQYFPDWDGLSIVDVGCGTGELLSLVHSVFPKWAKYGVDFSPEVIKFCQQYNSNFQFKCADAASTGYVANSFYTTVCMETIEHVDDPRLVIRELARITAPKGDVIISTPLLDKNQSDEHMHEFSIEDVIDLLRPYGELHDIRVVAGGLSIAASCKIPWS